MAYFLRFEFSAVPDTQCDWIFVEFWLKQKVRTVCWHFWAKNYNKLHTILYLNQNSTNPLWYNSFRGPKSRKLKQRVLCTNLYYIENLSKGFKRDRISSTMEWPMMENEVLSVIFALNVLPILVSFTVIDHFI
jgi:hypothetical protein